MLEHNFYVARQNIRKYYSQNVICVLGLSASLLCFALCMHFSRYIMGYDKHFENYERIAQVYFDHPQERTVGVNALEGNQILNATMNTLQSRCMVIGVVQYVHYYQDETGMDVPVELNAVDTDSAFAEVFSVKVLAGSWKQAADSPNSLVISESKACSLFGSAENAVGRTLHYVRNYNIIYTIQAVIADLPRNTSIYDGKLEALKLNDADSPRHWEHSKNWLADVYGLMPDGVELDDVSRELTNSVLPSMTHTLDNDRTGQTMVAAHIGESYVANRKVVVRILTIFGLLVLSVGLLNFLHFLVGSILNRSREFSLRRMYGCRLSDLFWMLFTQTFLLLATTAVICMYVCYAFIPFIQIPDLFADTLQIDESVMLRETGEYLLGLLLLCTVICLIVSYRIHHITIQRGVVGISSAPRIRRHVGRNLMMGLQFFICWIFVSLTVGFYLQVRFSTGTVLGSLSRAEKEQILSIPLSDKKTLMHLDDKLVLIDRLKAHAGVKEALVMDNILTDVSGSGLLTECGNSQTRIDVPFYCIPYNYYQFADIEVVRGVLPETVGQIAADEEFASLFDEDILGRVFYLTYNNTPLTVTAIVKSVPRSLKSYDWARMKKNGAVYMDGREWNSTFGDDRLYLKCHPQQVEAVRNYVMEELRKAFAASIEPEVYTLMDDIEAAQGVEVALQDIIRFFAIVSLTITLLGVYSAITLDTERRRREVALRKVHGALFRDILWLFGRRYFYLLIIPFVLAFPFVYLIFYILSRSYSAYFNYGPLFWIAIFLSVAFLVVCTILWRILQVARTRPAEEIAKG